MRIGSSLRITPNWKGSKPACCVSLSCNASIGYSPNVERRLATPQYTEVTHRQCSACLFRWVPGFASSSVRFSLSSSRFSVPFACTFGTRSCPACPDSISVNSFEVPSSKGSMWRVSFLPLFGGHRLPAECREKTGDMPRSYKSWQGGFAVPVRDREAMREAVVFAYL